MDRQETAIGLLPLFPQRRQHDPHDRIIPLRRQPQRVVEPAGLVELRRADELVLEPEGIEEPPQHRVVVVAKAFILPIGIGDARQRLLHVLAQHLLLRNILWHLPHPVHIVGKADQPGGDIADHLEGAADHRGARHLAEGADMGQA